MPRKPRAEDLARWTPDPRRQRIGKSMFAARMCRWGRIGEAKAYCEKEGLQWPPFGNAKFLQGGFAGPQKAPPLPEQTLTPEQAHALLSHIAGIKPNPQVVSITPLSGVGEPPSPRPPTLESGSASPAPEPPPSAVDHGTQGDPAAGLVYVPHEIVAAESLPDPKPSGTRKAKIHHFCVNPRVAGIVFVDGNKEPGTLALTRAFRLNEEIDVLPEPGSNIYAELRKRV